jgi:hypothetical protein
MSRNFQSQPALAEFSFLEFAMGRMRSTHILSITHLNLTCIVINNWWKRNVLSTLMCWFTTNVPLSISKHSNYRKHQTWYQWVNYQDICSSVSTGCMFSFLSPISLANVFVRMLTNRVVPGTRVIINGIYSIFQTKQMVTLESLIHFCSSQMSLEK